MFKLHSSAVVESTSFKPQWNNILPLVLHIDSISRPYQETAQIGLEIGMTTLLQIYAEINNSGIT